MATQKKPIYNPLTVSIIVTALNKNLTVQEACKEANISLNTFRSWLTSYPKFKMKVEFANWNVKQKIKSDAIESIREKFTKDWKCAAWYLEHCHPEEFSKERNQKFIQLSDKKVDINYVLPESAKPTGQPSINIVEPVEPIKEENDFEPDFDVDYDFSDYEMNVDEIEIKKVEPQPEQPKRDSDDFIFENYEDDDEDQYDED